MSKKNTATVLPFPGNSPTPAPIEGAVEPFTSVILQSAFTSAAEHEEFMQAITMHGVTFLRCATAPLSRPTIDDLSLIERLAKTLNRIWPTPSSKAVRS